MNTRRTIMHPVISVVIPAFNEERFIGACVQSLREQNFDQPFEIIVVDNNSTDATATIAAGLGARIVTAPQRGVCFARQAGTEVASGDIIISTDADTVFPRHWLQSIWRDFQSHPEIVAVAGTVHYLQAPWWGNVYARMLFGYTQFFFHRTGRVRFITACNTAFRKSAWSGYNTKLTQGGDELGLLKQLSARGPILFRRENIVTTSSRRLHQGLLYNLFVTSLFYYVVDYLIGRMIGRSVLGSYRPVRQERASWSGLRALARSVVIMAVIFTTYSVMLHPATAQRLVRTTGSRLDAMVDHVHLPSHPYFH